MSNRAVFESTTKIALPLALQETRIAEDSNFGSDLGGDDADADTDTDDDVAFPDPLSPVQRIQRVVEFWARAFPIVAAYQVGWQGWQCWQCW